MKIKKKSDATGGGLSTLEEGQNWVEKGFV